MEVEGRITGALRGGDGDWQILGPAPREDRVDGGFLDRQPTVVRRHLPDQLAARPPRAGQHALDPLATRGYDREPVGHTLVEPDLEFVGRRHAGNAIPREAFRQFPERVRDAV
jgi:hypothetical protein